MKKGLQQKELAHLLGVNRETVRRWERDIVNPNAGLKPQIVQILGERNEIFENADGESDRSII